LSGPEVSSESLLTSRFETRQFVDEPLAQNLSFAWISVRYTVSIPWLSLAPNLI